jgi:uncharacterized coiled-coil DUF342 family protein
MDKLIEKAEKLTEELNELKEEAPDYFEKGIKLLMEADKVREQLRNKISNDK